jgi:hypothetical protein
LKQSEVIRNWKPWESSTGAITPEGKAIAAQNSLKHGWHTAEMIIRKRMNEMIKERRAIESRIPWEELGL